ncbi:hypothetical protein DPMN_111033 [Dreissena polymorpha]|uniref:Uncharacterized protein n=1 Tax=Dreissena polymorpha TaxID=45954 RepID=A0A9D4KDV9_DREPO|nr:hypothetical protein DPMN_111033 [Dreissena polymorpha]
MKHVGSLLLLRNKTPVIVLKPSITNKTFNSLWSGLLNSEGSTSKNVTYKNVPQAIPVSIPCTKRELLLFHTSSMPIPIPTPTGVVKAKNNTDLILTEFDNPLEIKFIPRQKLTTDL